MVHGRVKTTEFFYSLNIGPSSLCIFCGLSEETAEHLFHNCHHASRIWREVSSLINVRIDFIDGVTSGAWIENDRHPESKFVAYVCAAVIWWIWKARCSCNLRNVPVDHSWIVKSAVDHVGEHKAAANEQMRNLLSNIRIPANS